MARSALPRPCGASVAKFSRHGENLYPSGMQTRSRWVTGLVYAVLVIFVIGIFLSSGLFSPG